jgi:hypothetical protein
MTSATAHSGILVTFLQRTHIMSDNLVSILNDLVETSKDGEKGVQTAAEDTKSSELQAAFLATRPGLRHRAR